MPKTFYSAAEAASAARAFGGDIIQFALSLLHDAAQSAVVPVSDFQVGAVAVDDKGNLYLGANQETAGVVLAQTVHAEQSAVAHAFSRGAGRLAHIVVNCTPCGHCRQFLNETRGSENLQIHLPHSRNNPLHHYLPDSFGPADLGMAGRLLDKQNHHLTLQNPARDALAMQALDAARQSYAPYSRQYAGVALETRSGGIFVGRYAENAAYNPSLPPLQSALNFLRLSGRHEREIVRGALVCFERSGHEVHTQTLWNACLTAPLDIHFLEENHG
ncbi:cytidine deaminase [Neisseria leonii]|uniref:cytidine deaminase n=1 Tax=Neisseria leonii TaxID=2995413 RepID=UPI0030D22086